jgi:hypothetical protein
MRTTTLHSAARLAFAGLALAAIIVQLHHAPADSRAVVNFFSFFTIDANLLAIVVLSLTAVRGSRPRSAGLEALRGAATLYMAITGVVFALLLSGLQEDLQLTLPWVNDVLHTVMPIVLVADWLLDRPRVPLERRWIGVWLLFPIAWAAYTLVRGPIVDWYPYPFIDPRVHGYGGVAAIAIVLALGFALVAALVWLLGWRRVPPVGATAGLPRRRPL